mmetsp:Transcript_15881/g.24741  ORF Transcript_15881/g.24741 Transcript_15881/m.24741 type:complete len:367 (+) Transcript_15881:53-1153(+)
MGRALLSNRSNNSPLWIAAVVGGLGVTAAYVIWNSSGRHRRGRNDDDGSFPIVDKNSREHGLLVISFVQWDDTSKTSTTQSQLGTNKQMKKHFLKWNLTLDAFDIQTIYCGRIVAATAAAAAATEINNEVENKNDHIIWHGIYVSVWKDRDHFEQSVREHPSIRRLFVPGKQVNTISSNVTNVESYGVLLESRSVSSMPCNVEETRTGDHDMPSFESLANAVANDISTFGHEDSKNVCVLTFHSPSPKNDDSINSQKNASGDHAFSAENLHYDNAFHCSPVIPLYHGGGNNIQEENSSASSTHNNKDGGTISIIQLSSNKAVFLNQLRSKQLTLSKPTDFNTSNAREYKWRSFYTVSMTISNTHNS